MPENLRDKHVASQPKARQKAKLSTPLPRKNYEKKPEKESDQTSQNRKQFIMEENDYKGARPVDDQHTVTEKVDKK